MPAHRLWMKSGASGRAVNFNHAPVDDDENHDAQYPHGDANEEGLQKQPEQGTNVHLHQAGLQHGQTNVVDTGVSGNDAAGIGHHLLGDVEHRHHDVESRFTQFTVYSHGFTGKRLPILSEKIR